MDVASGIEELVRAGLLKPSIDGVLQGVRKALPELLRSGAIDFPADCNLGGAALEIRVRSVLEEVGFEVAEGRPGLEDLVVMAPDGADTKFPWVVEVKSSSKPQLNRDDLRQLDDWVFDLSQEAEARRNGLGGGFDPLAVATDGFLTGTHHHPSPHKGVMITNTMCGIAFQERDVQPLAPNDTDFVEKRNFCILPLDMLLEWQRSIEKGDTDLLEFWQIVHESRGVLD